MADDLENKKSEETVPQPRRKVEKPINPLAQKPGQNYGSTQYGKEKAYIKQTVEECNEK